MLCLLPLESCVPWHVLRHVCASTRAWACSSVPMLSAWPQREGERHYPSSIFKAMGKEGEDVCTEQDRVCI